MSRATNKNDLLNFSAQAYDNLMTVILELTDKQLSTPFDFSNDVKKKEAHWSRDKNLRDVLIHLYEWHQLMLNWVQSNQSGQQTPFLPAPYNWKTYGQMNIEFFNKHQGTQLSDAKQLFTDSHQKVLALANTFSQEQLFDKDAFEWVGGSVLGSYFTSVMPSHYEWAAKKLKAHKKNVPND